MWTSWDVHGVNAINGNGPLADITMQTIRCEHVCVMAGPSFVQ